MKTIPLLIQCLENHCEFTLNVESVTSSSGSVYFTFSGERYEFKCDYFSVCFYPDDTMHFVSIIDCTTTYLDLHRELFGN